MSTKFEQLLDLLVNEEHEQANELFHDIVVEMSRGIYENLIAEEADEEEEMDEASEEEDESVEEASEEEDESVEENMDLEDSYSMEAGPDDGFGGGEEGDATDDLGAEIGADGDDMGGEEGGEDAAIFDIKNAIAELEAAFAQLEKAQGGEEGGFGDEEGGFGDEEGGEDQPEDEMMGMHEGRRVTREYVEKVGNDWEKSGSQKAQGQYLGAGTGEKDGAPVEGKSPISSGKGKPNTGATAANILKPATEPGTNTGTSPAGKAGGFLSAAKEDNAGNGNVPGGKMGVKNLAKVPGGHGAEKKGSGPGPVGSGKGDKAGQTDVPKIPQFLKKL
jgi:hypothetical protein